MTRINWHMAAAAAVLAMASPAGSLPAAAQAVGTETTVYTFTGATDGQNPADLVPYTDGNFYGTSDNTVFKVTPGGVFTTLHTFCPACGTSPPVPSGLVVGTDGNFYGLTGAADSMGATFYKITPGGAYTALNSSVTGNPAESVYASDSSQLILGTDGNFYGANSNGGASGSIFKIAPDGTFTTLYSFTAAATNGTNADGKSPQGKLIQGADGNFYGTTSEGGAYASGTVFQLTPAGVLTSLYSFGAVGGAAGTAGQNMDGLYPVAGLVQGTDGDFYGGTTNGGLHGIGTLFKVTAAGAYTVLHQFSNATTVSLTLSVNPTTISLGQTAALTWTSTGDPVPEGGGPLHSLVLGQDGNFYGFGGEVASASDTVFQMSPNGTFTTIVPASASSPNGGDPNSLFQIGNGTFYGSTRYGNDEGTANPYGTVFSMTLGTGSASQPCTASTSPTSNGGTWSGAEVANGSVIVTPTATGTYVYSLSCTYPQPSGTVGPAYAQLTVTGAAAPTVSITANPTSVSVGQSSTLTWSSTNASSCSASGAWSGSESLSGSFVVTPAVAGAQTYTLVCSGAGGNATASATVTATAAVAPTPTVTISASPTSITLGQNSTLTWTSTNATSCSASGAWTGAQAVSGSQAVTPIATGTSTYTLNCTGAGGSAQASAAVTVNTAPAPAVTVSVSTTSITLGASVLVTWSSTNATSCTASGAWTGTQATAGSIEETPTAVGTATYTLACSGSGSTSATANAVVTVQSAVAPGDTNLSGRAGGGGLGWSSLLGLAMLAVLRSRRAIRAACLAGMAACGFILPAAAQTSSPQLQFNWDNSYVGLRLGSGDYRESSSELDARIGAAGYSGTDTSITHHRLGGGVFAGVPFYGPLSLELGYADLGRYPIGITTPSTDIAGLSQTTARKLWPAGQAITLGFAAPLDVASWLAVEPRVAGLAFRSKQEVFTPLGTFSDDRSGGGLDAGLSLLIHASRTVSFGAGFDCFDLGGHCTVLMYSAEFSYHFGH